jgi:hypothetical protein
LCVCDSDGGRAEGADNTFREALPFCFTCLASRNGARCIESMFKRGSRSHGSRPLYMEGIDRNTSVIRIGRLNFELEIILFLCPFFERATFSHCTHSIRIWLVKHAQFVRERLKTYILGIAFCFQPVKYPCRIPYFSLICTMSCFEQAKFLHAGKY